MQFSKLFLTALSLAFAQTAVAAPKDHVTAAANRYLSYLDEYRLEHPDLSPKQDTSIKNMINLANNMDQLNQDSEAAIREEAIEAFGHDEGLALLNPRHKRANKNKRKQECDCADASAYCPTGWSCKKGYKDCETDNWGCGFSGVYTCDGMCIG